MIVSSRRFTFEYFYFNLGLAWLGLAVAGAGIVTCESLTRRVSVGDY